MSVTVRMGELAAARTNLFGVVGHQDNDPGFVVGARATASTERLAEVPAPEYHRVVAERAPSIVVLAVVTAAIWLVVGRYLWGYLRQANDPKDRDAGNALLERVAHLLDGEYVPAAAAYSRVGFGEVHGRAGTLEYQLTIVPPAADEHRRSAYLHVRSDTGRSPIGRLTLSQTQLPLNSNRGGRRSPTCRTDPARCGRATARPGPRGAHHPHLER